MMFNGMEIHESLSVPEFKESHRKERKWAHRLMFKRYQRFTYKYERVVISMGGELYVHPNTMKVLNGQFTANP